MSAFGTYDSGVAAAQTFGNYWNNRTTRGRHRAAVMNAIRPLACFAGSGNASVPTPLPRCPLR